MKSQKRYSSILSRYSLPIAAILFIASCTYNNEEELYGNLTGECDTTAVSYAADIVPVLQSNCYGCHSQATTFGGVNVEGYSRAKTLADNGRLLGSVSHAAGFSAMPKNGSKLPDCEINKIRSWINAGSPNNWVWRYSYFTLRIGLWKLSFFFFCSLCLL